jgi:hypothetical protein
VRGYGTKFVPLQTAGLSAGEATVEIAVPKRP